MIKKSLFALSMLAGLSGCVSQDFLDAKAENQAIHQSIKDYTYYQPSPKVAHISAPPVNITPIKEQSPIDWLNTSASISVADMPLSSVISRIMTDTGVNISFDSDVNPNKRVSLSLSGTRADILDALSKQVDYGIKTEPKRLTIRAFESETFEISLPTGMYTGQMGSQGSQAESTGETGGSPRIEGQFLNIAFDKVDVFNEIERGIKAILSKDGNDDEVAGRVQAISALSIINVRTTPSRMNEVRSFVDIYQQALSKQVILDIQVLEFSSNLGKEHGIDWNLIKDVGQGTLEFFVPGTNTISKGAGYGLAFQGTGKWDGTTAFIKALEKQGSVTTSTPITGMVLNNQPATINQTVTVPFMSQIKTQANDNVVESEVTRDKVSTGVDMMLVPKVEDNYVWLRISGKLSKITNDEREDVKGTTLRFLTTQNSSINFVNKLRYGQSYVIASVKQSRILGEKTKNFGLDILGGQGSTRDSTETLVILTPRRAQ
ncbi:type II secretion system protein GspD [Photobacterium damselae]|uniref:type II secretion system protein GspD n=1 Tax=Photobacterium damselae TaxID=38293 RepID=UPI001EFDA60C|nr:type II and III secretion system protein [Photobacterium damselae]MCG9706491.1 type II and III secretion system protein [Photobacterium damselae]